MRYLYTILLAAFSGLSYAAPPAPPLSQDDLPLPVTVQNVSGEAVPVEVQAAARIPFQASAEAAFAGQAFVFADLPVLPKERLVIETVTANVRLDQYSDPWTLTEVTLTVQGADEIVSHYLGFQPTATSGAAEGDEGRAIRRYVVHEASRFHVDPETPVRLTARAVPTALSAVIDLDMKAQFTVSGYTLPVSEGSLAP